MLISWTQLLGQTGRDTIKCYTISELKNIATGLVEYRSCIRQLDYADQIILNRDNDIDIKNQQILNLSNQISLKDKLIMFKSTEIDFLSKQLKLVEIKNKNLSRGFNIMVGIATTAIIIAIINP